MKKIRKIWGRWYIRLSVYLSLVLSFMWTYFDHVEIQVFFWPSAIFFAEWPYLHKSARWYQRLYSVDYPLAYRMMKNESVRNLVTVVLFALMLVGVGKAFIKTVCYEPGFWQNYFARKSEIYLEYECSFSLKNVWIENRSQAWADRACNGYNLDYFDTKELNRCSFYEHKDKICGKKMCFFYDNWYLLWYIRGLELPDDAFFKKMVKGCMSKDYYGDYYYPEPECEWIRKIEEE